MQYSTVPLYCQHTFIIIVQTQKESMEKQAHIYIENKTTNSSSEHQVLSYSPPFIQKYWVHGHWALHANPGDGRTLFWSLTEVCESVQVSWTCFGFLIFNLGSCWLTRETAVLHLLLILLLFHLHISAGTARPKHFSFMVDVCMCTCIL